MRIHALDIGGSGVKAGVVDVTANGPRLVRSAEHLGKPQRWSDFASWLPSHLKLESSLVGVSCAGHVDSRTGSNRYWSIPGWCDYPLSAKLRSAFPGTTVAVLNDVEAHLYAHAGSLPHPILAVAVGTSIGIALTDDQGRFVRTNAGRPLEFGDVRIVTSAKSNRLWWALGHAGLDEISEKHDRTEAARRFGWRLGAFLAEYAAVFAPRSVSLSGGIIAHNWSAMRTALEEEFRKDLPGWWYGERPRLHASPFGQDAALVGAARWAAERAEQA